MCARSAPQASNPSANEFELGTARSHSSVIHRSPLKYTPSSAQYQVFGCCGVKNDTNLPSAPWRMVYLISHLPFLQVEMPMVLFTISGSLPCTTRCLP